MVMSGLLWVGWYRYYPAIVSNGMFHSNLNVLCGLARSVRTPTFRLRNIHLVAITWQDTMVAHCRLRCSVIRGPYLMRASILSLDCS